MKTNKKILNSIPAVIYARYSSQGQNDASIEQQIRECRRWAKQNGYKIVKEYSDHALTGRTDKRPSFQQMIMDSSKMTFQAVIVWKLDRFSRNRYDSAKYKHQLSQNGVKVISAMEPVSDGPEGIIIDSLLEGMAEYYSANLSENVKRGLTDNAMKRKTIGGQMPLGLTRGDDGKYEIVPEEAAIIKRIYQEYADGKMSANICKDLNNEGIRTKKGKLFTIDAIRKIIINEKYKGVYKYHDIVDNDGIPAIVTPDLWKKANLQQAKNKHKSGPHNMADFILTGKVYCGLCGATMPGDSAKGENGQMYFYYTCMNKRKHLCKMKRINKDTLENFVINKLTGFINSDKWVEEVADKCMEYQDAHNDTAIQIKATANRIADNEKRTKNLIDAMEAGATTPATIERIKELQKEKEDLQNGLNKLQLESPYISREMIIYYFEKMRTQDHNSKQYQNFLINTFLNKIYLYNDGSIKMILNYSGKESELKFSDIQNINNKKSSREKDEDFCSSDNGWQLSSNFEIMDMIIYKNALVITLHTAL